MGDIRHLRTKLVGVTFPNADGSSRQSTGRAHEMPITERWWQFSEGVIAYDKDEPGVYELGDSGGTVVYIGSSIAIRRRLREHLNEPPTTCIKRNTTQYRIEYTTNYLARERQLYDDHARVNGKPPRCNEVRP